MAIDTPLDPDFVAHRAENPSSAIGRRTRALVAGVVLLALALRLYGIDYGLPYRYGTGEDNFITVALEMLANRDPNPHYFQHPGTTTIYLLATTYAALFGVGYVTGRFDSPEAFQALLYEDPSLVLLAGRVEIAIFGAVTVLMVYIVGRRLFDFRTALLASFVTAIFPLHVFISQRIRTDIEMGLLLLVVFWYCLDIVDKGNLKSYLLAGIFTGLAVVTKYPAVTIAAVVVLAHFFSLRNPRDIRPYGKLVAAGAVSIITAFVTSPFLFIDWQKTLADIQIETRTEHLSHSGEGLANNLIWYARGPFVENFTVLGIAFLLVGLVLCFASKNKGRILVGFYAVMYMVFISALTLRWERWIVAAMPFFAFLFAYGLTQVYAWSAQKLERSGRVLVATAAILVVAVPTLAKTIQQDATLAGDDTRTVARAWMLDHLPAGSRVLMEQYTPQLPKDHFHYYLVHEGELVAFDPASMHSANVRIGGYIGELADPSAIRSNQIEYFVLADGYDRYLLERERYPRIVQTYEQLMARGVLIFESLPEPGRRDGPPIRVYQVSS